MPHLQKIVYESKKVEQPRALGIYKVLLGTLPENRRLKPGLSMKAPNSHLSPAPVGNFIQSEIQSVFHSLPARPDEIPYRHRVQRDNQAFHE